MACSEGLGASCSLVGVMEENQFDAEGSMGPAVTREGEWPDFVAFYRANVTAVFRYVHRRCRDRALAEDVTQDVFMSVIEADRPVSEFETGWLITAAQHRLIDLARRKQRYARKLRLLKSGLAGRPDFEAVDSIVLAQALGQLSVDHRLVLSLHYLDGLPVAELAGRLGRSPKSVEGLMTRARQNLHRELEQIDA